MTLLPSGWFLQQWQYGGPIAGELSIEDAIQLAIKYKAAGITEKVMDGVVWMGNVQGAMNSPTSVSEVEAHMNQCWDAGLQYIPWVNPLWGTKSFLVEEAQAYAAIGQVTSWMLWDTEPFDQFWGANRPAGDASILLDNFRADAPHCYNVWQPDPRPARLAEMRPEEWSRHMHVYAPQSYWVAFDTNWSDEIKRAYQQSIDMGIQECAPTMSASAAPTAFATAINLMGALGITSTVAWRMGTLNAGHLETLRDLCGTTPAPPDPCAALKDELARKDAEIDQLTEIIKDAAFILNGVSE